MANIIEKAKARLKEARGSDYTLYHKSYTDAINHALSHHQKFGLNVSDDDRFQHVGVGSKKPSEGNTTSVSMPATHTSGKKHMVHVQVFNKGGTHPYELNTYSSGMGRNVKEATDNYPREGFPKEGDYGYHPNPGLKPQESDKDQDMDVAYKKATEKEGRKPLNAKTTEVSNTVDEAYGMWKVDFPKQHAGKAVAAGSVHVKAQNTAHAHKVAAKRVGVDHTVFKSKVTKSSVLPEEAVDEACWDGYKRVGMKKKGKRMVPNCVPEATDIIAKAKAAVAKKAGAKLKMDPDTGTPDHFTAAARRKKGLPEEVQDITERGEDSKGHYRKTEDGAGLTRKGAKAMGIKTAVTTPPSKLDPKGEAAGRRRSFCARMGGMKGPMKDEKGRPTRKAMSLRRWNCNEEIEQINEYGIDQNAQSVSNGYTPKTPPKRPPIAKPTMHPAAEKPRTPQSSVGSLSRIRAGMAKRLNNSTVKEELGKEDEWGSPELRKKWAAMTPGQEGLAADKIPAMNPFSGDAIQEQQLDEISALGAKKRSEFAAKLRKTLADPKKIAKAKKDIAKKKAVQRAEEPKHLVMQLRKATSIGSKVKFYDGAEHHVAPNHVEKFNDRYHSLKSSIEKEGLVKRAHKSHADFMRAISEETMGQTMGPCTDGISPANYPSPYQVSPLPGLEDMNADNEANQYTEADLAVIEADVTNEIESSSWQDLSKYYDAEDLEDEDDNEGELDEAITPQGRLKKRFAAMRNKTRRNLAKNMALKRIATPDVIKGRSIRAARRMVYKRILRNRDPSSVSASEKARIEAQVKRMAPMVSRLSIRLQQSERKRDQSRVTNARTKKK